MFSFCHGRLPGLTVIPRVNYPRMFRGHRNGRVTDGSRHGKKVNSYRELILKESISRLVRCAAAITSFAVVIGGQTVRPQFSFQEMLEQLV